MAEQQKQIRHTGDTEVAIAGTLKRDGVVMNLTGLTVEFAMFDALGAVKVAQTASNVTVTDAVNGEVQYNPQTADVDTAGVFNAYFVVTDGSSNEDTFPVESGNLKIEFHGD